MGHLKKRTKIQPYIWVLLFSLLGFGLRVQKLSFQPLWGDEGWSFYFAMQTLPNLLALTAIDIHPPLYYVLLKFWLTLMGVGPEAARLFSAFTGTLLIPALYVLGRRLFNNIGVGIAAAAVGAVMPLAIYYAQEVRMYQLVTLLGVVSVYSLVRWQEHKHRGWLMAYIGVTVVALYTHYYAGFLVLGQAVYLLLVYVLTVKRKKFSTLVAHLAPLLWVSLLYLPWLIYLRSSLVTYIENKRDVEGYMPLNLIRFLGDHFIAFSVGHLSNTLQQYVWVAIPFIILAVLGGIALFSTRKPQRYLLLLYLFTPLLIGYLINLAFPFTPPFFERTLLLAAPAYWILIAAGIIWLWDRQYLLVGTFVLALLLIINVSLFSFYTTPRYPDEDYRPLLQDIAARATVDDTLLASYQWQLGFYHAYLPAPTPRLFSVPGWGQRWADDAGQPRLRQDLENIFAVSPRLWFPAHQTLGHFWEDQTETAIAQLGYPTLLEWYNRRTKLTLAASAPAAVVDGPTANFDDRLTLLSSGIGSGSFEAGRGIVPVELLWQKEKSLGSEHLINLRLTDADGRTWAVRDSYPQAGQAHFTDLAASDTLTDRHGLLIPAGTPPGDYRLLLSVRRVSDAHPLDLLDDNGQPLGAELPLAHVNVIAPNPAIDPAALPVQFATNSDFNTTAKLVGYSIGNGPFKSGQPLPLTLFWQSLVDRPNPLVVSVQLLDTDGQPVVIHEQPPIRAATDWSVGTLLRDPHDVLLPPTLAPGQYQLVVGLLTPQQTFLEVDGNKQVVLTTITTIDRVRNFEPPEPQIDVAVNFSDQAQLIGLDMNTQAQAGESLPLTLYWTTATIPDQNWTVFVHLINEAGDIVAQQDQIPGGGQLPTTGWLPQETIADAYHLLIPADTLPGQYWLRVGLYNANDFSRLPVVELGEVVNDHVILESWPISVE